MHTDSTPWASGSVQDLTRHVQPLLAHGAFHEAEQACVRFLAHHDRSPGAWHLLGTIYQQLSQLAQAAHCYDKALTMGPDAKILTDLGIVQLMQQHKEQAEQLFEQAVALQPRNLVAWVNLGVLRSEKKAWSAAASCYRQALSIHPGFETALLNLAFVLLEQEAYDEAQTHLQTLLDKDATHLQAQLCLSDILVGQDQPTQALHLLQGCMVHHPHSAMAYQKVGLIYQQLGHKVKAQEAFQAALSRDESLLESLLGLASVLKDQEQLNAAQALYMQGLQRWPDHPLLLNGYGHLLFVQDRLEEAAFFYQQALDRQPELAAAWLNRGILYWQQGAVEPALACLDQLLTLKPSHAGGHSARAELLLYMARFKEAWQGFHWRLKTHEASHLDRHTQWPMWQGQPLQGKQILVMQEQGVGDEVMFAAQLPALLARGAEVVWECDARLMPLFERSFAHKRVRFLVKGSQGLPDNSRFDYRAFANSLFQYLCDERGFPLVPQRAYLQADAPLVTELRRRYQQMAQGKTIIGISWQTSAEAFTDERSIPLPVLMAPLQARFGSHCFFVNLQYGAVQAQCDALRQQLGCTLYQDETVDAMASLDDFTAQVEACDGVISIDNSTVHVAGALDKPTMVLLPLQPSWRWGVQGTESYWYRSLKLLRNPVKYQWSHGIAAVLKTLPSWLSQGGRGA
ncbi:tetratricopeptide repeat protein [Magnetococcus sp. PR-3]|uniref:tetratricopeptide repeat protein n=1 Tax=Magnetococcus sp. PR-3 TaxID=3120355 RepID=UPI002FCDE2BA